MKLDLARLNSATKYPSIETYHTLDPRTGKLAEPAMAFTGPVVLTEKVNGTNGRIIVMPDGDWFIGSREELLYASGDRIMNPALGIVPALMELAPGLLSSGAAFIRVYFLEVYGHKIGGAAKQYTSTPGLTGYRMFDAAQLPLEVLSWEREKISSWREHGGQQFFSEEQLRATAADYENLLLVPRTGEVPAEFLPQTLEEAQQFLQKWLPETQVALDGSGLGQGEGLVLRDRDRAVIAKARFEDYERTLRPPQQKGRKS